jgi:hypothetical protein
MPEPWDAADFRPARLFPTAGIKGDVEAEARATSALLSVLPAVPAFGRALLSSLGARPGALTTYTEVRLTDAESVTHVPDGALITERGGKRWSALLEVKTARNELEADQALRYLGLARRYGFDALYTISNQIVADPTDLPYKIKGQKVGKLALRHLSWWQVLTEAIVQHRFRGIDDPDQAWILGELIHYLTDERSGASGFLGMGEGWVEVRDGARQGTIQPGAPQTRATVARWEQLLAYLCLNLSQELGVVVRARRARGKPPAERLTEAARLFAERGLLEGAFTVPGAIGPVELIADLKAKQLTTSVPLPAPTEPKRPLSRIKWLLRQLDDAPHELRLEVRFANRRDGCSALLRDCREDPAVLLLHGDPGAQPRSFELALTKSIRAKAGALDGSFVAEVKSQATDFYRDLVQDLRPPPATTPKLPEPTEPEGGPDPIPPPSPQPDLSESQVRREHTRGFQSLADLLRDAPL